MTLLVGARRRPIASETVCGDDYVLHVGEVTTIALADGLGHGPAAAEAATLFCAYVSAHVDAGLLEILHGASAALGATRGAVGAVLRIDQRARRTTFAGIGNIELRMIGRSPFHPVCSSGVIGRPVRKVVRFDNELADGDLFLMHSDGVSTRFDMDAYRNAEPQAAADAILAAHGKPGDDACCVVVRYRESAAP